MRVQVQLYSHLRMAMGQPMLDLDLPEGAPASAVIEHLRRMVRPELESMLVDRERGTYQLVFSLRGRRVGPQTPLQEGDVLSLLPPLGGG